MSIMPSVQHQTKRETVEVQGSSDVNDPAGSNPLGFLSLDPSIDGQVRARQK